MTAGPIRKVDLLRERQVDGATDRSYSVVIDMPVVAGSRRYYLGWASVPGYELLSIEGVTGTARAASTTSYYTFQPFVSRQKPDGTVRVTTLGTAVDTTSQGFVADTKRRLHAETTLAYQVPKEAAFGVDLTLAGSPGSRRFTFLVRMRYVG